MLKHAGNDSASSHAHHDARLRQFAFDRRVLTLSRPGGLLPCRLDGTAFDSYPRQKGELRGPRQPQGELEPRSDDSPHCDRRLGPVVLVGALAPISVAESTDGEHLQRVLVLVTTQRTG